jgi:DNA-binding ferritin-like protein (Dps family)
VNEIDKLVWEFPLFDTYEKREKFLKVLGLLISHQITLKKASELLGLDVEKLIFLLDILGVDYSFLNREEAKLEKEAVKKLLEELNHDPWHR